MFLNVNKSSQRNEKRVRLVLEFTSVWVCWYVHVLVRACVVHVCVDVLVMRVLMYACRRVRL